MSENLFFIIFPALLPIVLLLHKRKKNSSNKTKEFTVESTRNSKNRPLSTKNWRIEYEANRNQAIKNLANILQCNEIELESILASITYHSFSIRKRSGALRNISAPEKRLLKVQQKINQVILSKLDLHPACTSFRMGMSVKDNASAHLGNPYVLKVDLCDFFPSILRVDVRDTFIELGYNYHEANQLSHLCCYRGRLPQGAATSPSLSNFMVKKMDEELSELAGNLNLAYTRYADDLTFSGNYIDYDELIDMVEDIVELNYFSIRTSKTRKLAPNKRKIITGVSISNGDKMTIPRSKKREIRQAIYHIKTKGLKNHLINQGINDERYVKRLLGYLYFWNHIESDNPFVLSSIKLLKESI